MNAHNKFLWKTEQASFDFKQRDTLQNNLQHHQQAFKKNILGFKEYELALSRAAYLRQETLANLDKHLLSFEEKLSRRGGQVIWAENAAQACQEILKIIRERQVSQVVKAQSGTLDEIELPQFLQKNEIKLLDSNLGQIIAHYSQRSSGHLVDPLVHLSTKEILSIAHQVFDDQAYSEPPELLQKAKQHIQKQWEGTSIGITGANFLLADIGGIAFTENEGNIRLLNKQCHTHIVVVGLEKIIARSPDLDLFWTLLAGSATGQTLTAYNTLITAPAKAQEEGAKELIVILLDNGRTKLLSDPTLQSALQCIRCGACQHVCPIYQSIGGESYDSPYAGPIGAIVSPYLGGFKKFSHLSQASTLCGACNQVCPVKIDLTQLLLIQREKTVQQGLRPYVEKMQFGLWKRWMLRKKSWKNRMNFGNTWFDFLFLGNKNKRKSNREIPSKSFRTLWKQRNK